MWPGTQPTALSGMLGAQSISSNDDFDKWGAMFGPSFPTSNVPYAGGQRVQHENPPADRTLHNGYLGTLVYGLSLLDMPEFLLQILPVAETDTVDFTWDVMYFNTPMASIVPHEAPSRILTHSYSSGGAKAVRHGIGMLMDIETMKRPFGYSMFGMQIQQIRNSIQLTLVGDVIWALLDTNNPMHKDHGREARTRWLRAEGSLNASRDALIQQEILHYALVHKDPENGIKKRLVDVEIYARQNGFKPDAIICNENFKVHSTRLITDATYTLIDAYGMQEMRRNPDNVASIEGIPLYAIPPMNLYQDTQNIPTLNSYVQIGEYALMLDVKRDSDTANKCECRRMEERTIQMYDENKDGWVPVSILEAINNSGRFNDRGELNDSHDHLARSDDAMDMFLCKTHEGRNKKCELFGDMEEAYLDEPTIVQLARSMLGSLDDHDRSNVDSLVNTYEFMLRTVVPEPGQTTPYPPVLGVARRNQSFRSSELSAFVDGAHGRFFTVSQLRDVLRALDADEVRYCQWLRSWLGLELLAYQDPKVNEQLQSFLRYYNAMKAAFGDDHPFVAASGCPAHLRPYVDHPGPCNLFERVFGRGTTPILAVKTATVPTGTTIPATAPLPNNVTMPIHNIVRLKPVLEQLEETKTDFVDGKFVADQSGKTTFVEEGEPLTVPVVFFKIVGALHNIAVKAHALAEEAESDPDQRRDFVVNAHKLTSDFVALFDGITDPEKLKTAVTSIDKVYFQHVCSMEKQMNIADVKFVMTRSNLTVRRTAPTPYASAAPDDTLEGVAGQPITSASAGERMLLPLVYSANASSAWNAQMVAPRQNLASGFLFTIYRVDTSPMVPVTCSGAHIVEAEFDATIKTLQGHRTYAHRVSVLSDPNEFGVMDEVMNREPREPTERLPFQRLQHDVKRRNVDADHMHRMGAYDTDPHVFDTNPSFMHNYEILHRQSSAAVRGAMFTFITTRITKEAFRRLAMNGCVVPCNFIIARPFDVHMMSGIIVMQGGINTGRTMFALSNWTAGISPETKLFYANYTFYSKAMVFRPERVVHLQGLKYEQYCGGHNVRFFRQEERANLAARGFQLNHDDFNTPNRPSCLAMMIPYTENEVDTTFDLRGYFDDDPDRSDPPAYATAQFYTLHYQFNRVRAKTDYGMSLWYRTPQPKLVVTAGPWRVWTADGLFDPRMEHPWSGVGKGHHGMHVKDGETGKIRNGAALARSFPHLHSVRGV